MTTKKPTTKKTTKPPVDPKDPLHIGNEMSAFDLKDRDYFDNLSEDQKKKISPFLFIRWGSVVAENLPWYAEKNNRESLNKQPLNSANIDIQSYYLLSVNERLNKNFFDISTTEHKKFQWLLATTVSPGMGKFFHEWLPAKKEDSNNKAEKFLASIYPTKKQDEIELLAKINSAEDIKQLAKAHGWDDKRIKAEL